MKLRCINEARNENGVKVMAFTKGCTYEAEEIHKDGYTLHEVAGDNGFKETFFNLNVMFEQL